jgi:hypothetical protein
MSFNIILNTNNAQTINTAGKDFTWAFNFNSFQIEEGGYELTWSAFSTNIAQATFATVLNPIVNLDFSNQPNFFTTDGTGSINRSTTVIGVFKPVIVSATISCFQSEVITNPPITFKNINKSTNYIRVFVTQPGTNTLIATSLVNFTIILRFRKV